MNKALQRSIFAKINIAVNEKLQ